MSDNRVPAQIRVLVLLATILSVTTARGTSAQQCGPPTLIPCLPTGPGIKAPIPKETPIAAIARATMPATIRARRVELSSSESRELGYLVTRLSDLDRELLEYRVQTGAESFVSLIETLLAILERRAPALSSSLEQALPTISALLNERREINRDILRIVTPGARMSAGQHIEPTRSGPSDGNYQIFPSRAPATGAVVGPSPSPACHQEERIHLEYRTVLLPNGFDGNGTPLFRNVYHPFPIPEMVDVCR
jgi:hypothetical protein